MARKDYCPSCKWIRSLLELGEEFEVHKDKIAEAGLVGSFQNPPAIIPPSYAAMFPRFDLLAERALGVARGLGDFYRGLTVTCTASLTDDHGGFDPSSITPKALPSKQSFPVRSGLPFKLR